MKLLSERTLVKEGIASWLKRGQETYYASKNPNITPMISKLDPETATAKEVATIIGNTSWAGPNSCDECGLQTFALVQLGQEPDYESSTARICIVCLKEATELVEASTTN